MQRQPRPGLGVVAQAPGPRPCAHNRCCPFWQQAEQGLPPADRVTCPVHRRRSFRRNRTARLQQGQQPWNGAGVAVFCAEDRNPCMRSSVRAKGEQLKTRDRTRRRCPELESSIVSEKQSGSTASSSASSPASSSGNRSQAQAGLVENGGTDSDGLFSAPRLIRKGTGAIMSRARASGHSQRTGQAEHTARCGKASKVERMKEAQARDRFPSQF